MQAVQSIVGDGVACHAHGELDAKLVAHPLSIATLV